MYESVHFCVCVVGILLIVECIELVLFSELSLRVCDFLVCVCSFIFTHKLICELHVVHKCYVHMIIVIFRII